MKRKILIGLLILGFATLFQIKLYIFNSSKFVYSSNIIVSKLSEILKDWLYEKHSKAFDNITINIYLAEDIESPKIRNGLVEAVFYVNAKMRPKLTLEGISKYPFLIGIQRYIEENKNTLTDIQIKALETLFKERYDALKDSIEKLYEENGIFKIICKISTSGEINKDNIKIFYDSSVKDEEKWEDANDLFTANNLSYDEEENLGYEEAKKLIERLNKIYPNEITPKGFFRNFYNRNNARYYIDQYTSEANYNNHIVCKWFNEGQWVIETSHYTYIDIWNNKEYPLTIYSDGKYERLACYNCADYVSQAMYYGGMQTDNYWNPSNRKTGAPDGKWYWTYVPHLLDYMKNIRNDWSDSTYRNSYIGDIIVWSDLSHVAMIDDHYIYGNYTWNNFAAHTNDRRQHYYSESLNIYHYNVSCWRWVD